MPYAIDCLITKGFVVIKLKIIIGIVLLLCSSISVFAKDVSSMFQPSDWTQHEPFYLTAGYNFTRHFFRNAVETNTSVEPPMYYTARDTYPNSFSGMRLGFGTNIEKHFGYELDYTQSFAKTKTTNSLRITQSNKVLVGFITYTFNPEDRLRWTIAGAGAVTETFTTTRTLPPYKRYYSDVANVDVDPAVAVALTYQLNARFALKSAFIYKIKTYNVTLRSDLIPIFMLNYYPA